MLVFAGTSFSTLPWECFGETAASVDVAFLAICHCHRQHCNQQQMVVSDLGDLGATKNLPAVIKMCLG